MDKLENKLNTIKVYIGEFKIIKNHFNINSYSVLIDQTLKYLKDEFNSNPELYYILKYRNRDKKLDKNINNTIDNLNLIIDLIRKYQIIKEDSEIVINIKNKLINILKNFENFDQNIYNEYDYGVLEYELEEFFKEYKFKNKQFENDFFEIISTEHIKKLFIDDNVSTEFIKPVFETKIEGLRELLLKILIGLCKHSERIIVLKKDKLKQISINRTVKNDLKYNLHSKIKEVGQKLFIDGHYAQAVEEAFKKVIKEVKEIVNPLINEDLDGDKLMNRAFGFQRQTPIIKFNNLKSREEKDEQIGIMFLFKGIVFIRHRKAHDNVIINDPNIAFEYLSLASLLIRLLENAQINAKSLLKEEEKEETQKTSKITPKANITTTDVIEIPPFNSEKSHKINNHINLSLKNLIKTPITITKIILDSNFPVPNISLKISVIIDNIEFSLDRGNTIEIQLNRNPINISSQSDYSFLMNFYTWSKIKYNEKYKFNYLVDVNFDKNSERIKGSFWIKTVIKKL